MAEISKIDGFDVGIDSQRPQFFTGDKSQSVGIDLGLNSMQPQFYNDASYQRSFGVGTEEFNGGKFRVMCMYSL